MTQGVPPPPAGRRSRSMTDSPPWVGAVMIATLLLPALVLITYTLLPLPGQERFGRGNYLLAGAVFAANILLPRLLRRVRRLRRALRRHRARRRARQAARER
ncbi:hypothetical protein [Frankia canadensis]|nr:hypothetical protein [Frankia canadensis]